MKSKIRCYITDERELDIPDKLYDYDFLVMIFFSRYFFDFLAVVVVFVVVVIIISFREDRWTICN
jgi:hypothetical protein